MRENNRSFMTIIIYFINVILLSYFPFLTKALTANSHVFHLFFATLQSIVTDLKAEWQNGSDCRSLKTLKL